MLFGLGAVPAIIATFIYAVPPLVRLTDLGIRLVIGHLFITFKTNLFVKNFNNRIKNNIKTIKRLPKIKGIKEIMYPGQNKYKRFKVNSKKDIKISNLIKKDLEILKQ